MIQVNRRPVAGDCSISSTTPQAFLEIIRVECHGWEAETPLITYTITKIAQSDPFQIPLPLNLGSSTRSFFEFVLPDEPTTVIVTVSAGNGASSHIRFDVNPVRPLDPLLEQKVNEKINEARENQQYDLLNSLAHASVKLLTGVIVRKSGILNFSFICCLMMNLLLTLLKNLFKNWHPRD